LADRYPEDFERLSHDPDHAGRLPREKEREEARTALDLRDRGELPDDVDRPDGSGQGDFVGTLDGQMEYYDIKQFRDRWPPSSGRSSEEPLPPGAGGYTSAKFTKDVAAEIRDGRTVILDTRSLRQETIDDMAKIVSEKGWEDHVKWYP
jgi:hypothetical protein